MNVSVVIPCLDAERYLGGAIRSLLNQTRPPQEIIVADNGSADASRAIARSFGDHVRLVDVPERGASRARLAGLAEASGDALMFFDADDLLAPETLAVLVDVLARGEGDIACAPWYRFEQGEGGAWHWAPPSCVPRRDSQDDLSAWLTGWYHPPCSVLWSRRAYERSGGWDPDLVVNQDGDVMMRGLARGNRLVRTAAGAAFYRRLPEGGSLSSTARAERGIAARLEVTRRVIDLLDEDGRLPAYRAPLGAALARIGSDIPAGSEALVEERARLAARLGPFPALPPGRARLPTGSGLPGPDPAPPRPAPDLTPDRPDLRVSVVIPAYNRAATIARAVKSVLAQDHDLLEVIVVDDGSADDTRGVVAGIADPRLRLVSQDNRGASAARNRGIAEARGELVAFLDSDDEWLPGKLSAQVDLFRRGSQRLGLVYSGFEQVGADGSRKLHEARHRGWIYRDLLAHNVVTGCGSTTVFRRSALELVGGYDPALPANEDYDLVLRVCRFFEADCVPGAGAVYHDGAAAAGAVRVSRNAAANRASRQILWQRYGADMRRAGVDYLFFIACADRELYLTDGVLAPALRDAAKAIWYGPARPFAYRWVLTMFLPRLVRRVMEGGADLRASRA